MFNKRVHGTTLTSAVADRLFSNITTGTTLGTLDQSFLATLRALLHKRLPSNESVSITYKYLHLTEYDMSTASTSQHMNWFMHGMAEQQQASTYNIHIVHTAHSSVGSRVLEIVKASAGIGKRYMGGFTRRDDLHIFFVRKAKALFYTDASEKCTVIFTNKLELKQFHALQMMIPKYLPHLFTDNPLSEKETSLLKSLGNKSAIEYETLIEAFAKDLDLRTEIIRSKLAGFEASFERIKSDELRCEILTHQKDYEHYFVLMRDAHNLMQERMYTLAGLENSINSQSGDSELMEYFMCNKNLTILHVEGTVIKFIACGYADIYDIDAFEKFSSNHRGYLYQRINPRITATQMEMLYQAIFSDGIYKLRICAAYIVDMRTGLRPLQHLDLPAESRTYLPNPHIQSFGCIGNYAGRFQEYMQKRDYVGAIDQAVVSARNLNFYDSSVMARFAEDFSRTTITCLEAQDGSLLTPQEAISQLEGSAVCRDL